MIKTEQVVEHEFSGVRTGKASPALVENILVEVYGSQMRIRELAGITTPEPRMLLIQPWDAGSVHPIEKAIQKSNLGLNPTVQGKLIRLEAEKIRATGRSAQGVKLIDTSSGDLAASASLVERQSEQLAEVLEAS